jgi:hypothetical protein
MRVKDCLIGCAVDEDTKKIYERECMKEQRSVSGMTLILIKDFLLQRGIDSNKA